MDDFWDASWDSVDSDRIIQYVKGLDMYPDSIVSLLAKKEANIICDAGCGCGAYALKLAYNGFRVFGFDVAEAAIKIASQILTTAGFHNVELKAASIISTDYSDSFFDAVISRDVIDHIPFKYGIAAVKELYRIVKPGGSILFTLDHLDAEYEQEPHIVNTDGDYEFTAGKWNGMVFHPYSEEEIERLIQVGALYQISPYEDGLLVVLEKKI